MSADSSIYSKMHRGSSCKLWLACLLLGGFILTPSYGFAQNHATPNRQAQLDRNIIQQNNLKKNINFLLKLREQARSRAQLARTAKDRQTYNQWAGQYRQLQGRIDQYRGRLRELEGEERNIRGAIQYESRNRYQRSGQGGGKPMIPEYSAQNRAGSQNSSRVSPGARSGSGSGNSSGGGGYIPPRNNDPGSVNLLDQSAKQ